MASPASVLDLSRLVRGGLAVVATLLLAFLLAGAFVVATLTAALSALNPARPAGNGNGTSQAIPA
ncbi:MAG TPA: hypothetical protein VFU72_00250, partial [Nitrolancea sp.]|nr:hypothetical protein [Nitrolancea sp.]